MGGLNLPMKSHVNMRIPYLAPIYLIAQVRRSSPWHAKAKKNTLSRRHRIFNARGEGPVNVWIP